jgi:hypothetical protein
MCAFFKFLTACANITPDSMTQSRFNPDSILIPCLGSLKGVKVFSSTSFGNFRTSLSLVLCNCMYVRSVLDSPLRRPGLRTVVRIPRRRAPPDIFSDGGVTAGLCHCFADGMPLKKYLTTACHDTPRPSRLASAGIRRKEKFKNGRSPRVKEVSRPSGIRWSHAGRPQPF